MKSFNYEHQIEFINAIDKKYYVIPEIIKIIVIIMKFQYIQQNYCQKYCLKLYSLKTHLNNEINKKLIKREGKKYIPFFECLYNAVNKNIYNKHDKELYKFGNIKKEDFEKLNKFLSEKGDKKILVSSKSFLTFIKQKRDAFNSY